MTYRDSMFTDSEALVSTASDSPDLLKGEKGPDNSVTPEFREALEAIVTAFVDLGFGVSASDLATRSTVSDQKLLKLIRDFSVTSNL